MHAELMQLFWGHPYSCDKPKTNDPIRNTKKLKLAVKARLGWNCFFGLSLAYEPGLNRNRLSGKVPVDDATERQNKGKKKIKRRGEEIRCEERGYKGNCLAMTNMVLFLHMLTETMVVPIFLIVLKVLATEIQDRVQRSISSKKLFFVPNGDHYRKPQ